MTRELTHEEERVLPFIVNGTASAQEQELIAAALADDEARAAVERELAYLTALREGIKKAGASEESSPGEFGLQRLLRDVRREGRGGMPSSSVPSAQVFSLRGLAVAASLALAAVLGFGLARVTEAPSPYEVAGVRDAALLQIVFVPDAPEKEIRALLLETNLEIVDGPSALGVYRLARAGDEETSLEALRARLAESELVETVEME